MSEQPALTAAERQFLAFALGLAFDHMAVYGGFTDEDDAALARLRQLTEEPPVVKVEFPLADEDGFDGPIRRTVRPERPEV